MNVLDEHTGQDTLNSEVSRSGITGSSEEGDNDITFYNYGIHRLEVGKHVLDDFGGEARIELEAGYELVFAYAAIKVGLSKDLSFHLHFATCGIYHEVWERHR